MTTDPEALANAYDSAMQRVVKATWAPAPHGYYCLELECGHHDHKSELQTLVLCMECLRQKVSQG